MRLGLSIVGVLLIAVGGVWLAQGTGVLPGSVMTGVAFWAVVGAIMVLVGLVLLVFASRLGARDRLP